ncbi:MAG: hypothetical protein WD294_11190 [Phycisphaeraceae bacterium]
MSLKYQRIKKQDEALWPPIRWILRIFSSITLAVILLTTVCLYGTLTSVPIGTIAQIPAVTMQGLGFLLLILVPFVPLCMLGAYLSRGKKLDKIAPLWLVIIPIAAFLAYLLSVQGWWGYSPEVLTAQSNMIPQAVAYLFAGLLGVAVVAAVVAPAGLLGMRLARNKRVETQAVLAATFAVLALASAVAMLVYVIYPGIARVDLFSDFSREFGATTLYRLRPFEMTELEFYSWWPFQLILGIFVANLIVATIRRIEFKFVNIGVLTVHSGIIIIALGSMVYGSLKKEGDVVLFKPRFRGEPAAYFYDRNRPAIFLTHDGKEIQIPLPELPRYNDYAPDSDEHNFELHLHENEKFQEVFGDEVEVTIPGFYAYAELRDDWRNAIGPGPHADNPILTFRMSVEGGEREFALPANDPAGRVARIPSLDLAFFTDVDDAWMEALTTPTKGRHALIVEVPGEDFREVYTVEQQGQRITVGDTGYSLTVEQVMAQYPFPVATEGFQGAEPSAAVVLIDPPDGPGYQRWAIDPYPQLTQDFLPGADGGQPQRVPPNPEINVTYIDASRIKLTAVRAEGAEPDDLSLVYRLPGGMVQVEPVEIGEGVTLGGVVEITVEDFVPYAEKYHVPEPVPQEERTASEEGIYLHAALPVDVRYGDYHHREWLAHMRYIEHATSHIRPETFHVPGFGEIEVKFGRVRERLPFSLELVDFEMIPYEGTGQTDNPIPKDYISTLRVTYDDGTTEMGKTQLNNPMVVRGLPLTQALSGEPNRFLGEDRELGFVDYLALGKIKVSQAEWDPQNQAFTGLGIGNNAAIRFIAFGAVLMSIGIPWAFYVKPAILRARKRKIQAELAAAKQQADAKTGETAEPAAVNGRADAKADPEASNRSRPHDHSSV